MGRVGDRFGLGTMREHRPDCIEVARSPPVLRAIFTESPLFIGATVGRGDLQLAFSLRRFNASMEVHPMRKHSSGVMLVLAALASQGAWAQARLQLQGYVDQAQRPASASAGQRFFLARHGQEWSCASCHGKDPRQPGKHASTGRTIQALAPSANPDRFMDVAKTEKWFKRNCKDVLNRECTAGEKADVLAWLLTL